MDANLISFELALSNHFHLACSTLLSSFEHLKPTSWLADRRPPPIRIGSNRVFQVRRRRRRQPTL